jgi:hypothetical protein
MIFVSLLDPIICIIDMGRLKKYQTEEEKQAVKKQRAREYYWNNKEQEDEKARQRYRNKKLH